MKIVLNHTEEFFEQETLSIAELLKVKKFTFKMLVIKVNNKLVKKEHYDSTLVQDGDVVQVLHLISGG